MAARSGADGDGHSGGPQPPNSWILRRNSAIFETQDMGKRGKREKQLMQNGFNMKTNEFKISRIPMVSTAIVEVLHVHSPSLIWVRLTNHITDQLIIREPAEMQKMKPREIEKWAYCMVPLDPDRGDTRAFGRARIIATKGEKPNRDVLVLMIDEGTTMWAKEGALASMHSGACELLPYHPWQAIAISLAGVNPISNDKWSIDVCAHLRSLLSEFAESQDREFPLVKVQVVPSSEVTNDHGVTVSVQMYGIEDPNDREGVSIGALLVARCYADVEMFTLNDGRTMNKYDAELPNDEDERFIEPWLHQYPEGWQNALPERNKKQVPEDFDDTVTDLPIPDLEWLTENGYARGDLIYVNVEGQYTQSLCEFYARPIKIYRRKERTDDAGNPIHDASVNGEDDVEMVDDVTAMIDAADEVLEKASDLDQFYAQEVNRKGIDRKEVEKTLHAGKRMFAICEAHGERATFTGRFQRVEIFNEETFTEVRYLDSGGNELVLVSTLFQIHPFHLTYAPLCLQFCAIDETLRGLAKTNEDLTVKRERIRRYLREDMPVQLKIVGRLHPELDGKVKLDKQEVKEQAHTLFVSDIRVRNDAKSVVQRYNEETEIVQKNGGKPIGFLGLMELAA